MWSTVVTLRWRILKRRACKEATIFKRSLGRFFERIFRLAWLSTIVTSMSAAAHRLLLLLLLTEESLFSVEGFWAVARVEYWGKVKNSANGDNDGDETGEEKPSSSLSCFFVLLCWLSIDCKNCSSSLTKLMAPPTIDAWSPCRLHFSILGLEWH